VVKRVTCMALVSASTLLFATSLAAQQLTYQPINPSFGGSSFNSAHLLATAEINRPDPPDNGAGGLFGDDMEVTQAQLFAQQLERAILGRLSGDITNAIFGEDADPNGRFRVNETTEVVFETALNGDILVTILDGTSGGSSTIEIPSFLTQAAQ